MKDSILVERKSDKLIIMLHGYGANKYDLSSLSELDHGSDWLFPNGYLELQMGSGYYESRAWFPIDMNEFQRAMLEGRHRDLKESYPDELRQTLNRLKNDITPYFKTYNKIILGGFSQGAMCSSHLLLDEELSFDGGILLSGNLVAQNWMVKKNVNLPIFQSHGISDAILSFIGAQELYERLKDSNAAIEFHKFSGGHEIPPEVVKKLSQFLSRF